MPHGRHGDDARSIKLKQAQRHTDDCETFCYNPGCSGNGFPLIRFGHINSVLSFLSLLLVSVLTG